MKIFRRVLAILAVVLLVLIILAAGYLFFALNRHYFLDLRSDAGAYDRILLDIQHEDGVVRCEAAYADGRVDYVGYNADRECVAAQGITPIHFDRRNMWGIRSYEEFVTLYGDYHVDTGNMVFWPGWFTDDGYLITLWRGGERWLPLCISDLGEVWVYDLLAAPE